MENLLKKVEALLSEYISIGTLKEIGGKFVFTYNYDFEEGNVVYRKPEVYILKEDAERITKKYNGDMGNSLLKTTYTQNSWNKKE